MIRASILTVWPHAYKLAVVKSCKQSWKEEKGSPFEFDSVMCLVRVIGDQGYHSKQICKMPFNLALTPGGTADLIGVINP